VTDHENEKEDAHVRACIREFAKCEWAEAPDLPNPAYDPRTGWKLDEFAMYCGADALREYKRLQFNTYHLAHAKETDVLGPKVIYEYGQLITKQLLKPRYQVKGVRPYEFQPEVVSIPLLEHMLPIIETSELLDTSNFPEIARRRFEHVRVFELARKAVGGRPAMYDWERLADKIRTEGIRFSSARDLLRYCRDNVLLRDSGKRPQPGSPDDKTVREAITKHGLTFFVDKA
jgi:hypothetical protein